MSFGRSDGLGWWARRGFVREENGEDTDERKKQYRAAREGTG